MVHSKMFVVLALGQIMVILRQLLALKADKSNLDNTLSAEGQDVDHFISTLTSGFFFAQFQPKFQCFIREIVLICLEQCYRGFAHLLDVVQQIVIPNEDCFLEGLESQNLNFLLRHLYR